MKLVFWLLLVTSTPLQAIPVIPNFQQGVLQQRVETKSTILEDIKSYDIRNGYEMTIGGTNIESSTGNITPEGWTKVNTTINGVGTTYVSPNLETKPSFQIVEQGASFNYFETLETPGISNFTHITRETTIESITDSTSTFSQ
tara:strand:- start:359 stop:787 length:429 start_codon:yes stop_codon:yes gene_type:complete